MSNYPGLGPQYADFFGLARQLHSNRVVTSDGLFQEHPESYRPRVFVTVVESLGTSSVIEILQDGEAVSWPRLPDPMTCGFDYWDIRTIPGVTRFRNVTMVRKAKTNYPPSAEGEPDAK